MRYILVVLSWTMIVLASTHAARGERSAFQPTYHSFDRRTPDNLLHVLRARNPLPGPTQPAAAAYNSISKKNPVRAGFHQKVGGVSWVKNSDSTNYYHIGSTGAAKSTEDPNSASVGGHGTKGGVINHSVVGEHTRVSTNLPKGSELIVKNIQADGTSLRTKYDKPALVDEKFESGFPGHHMQLETELRGKGVLHTSAARKPSNSIRGTGP